MPDDLETRRRRAAWRASHRGTKELDFLIGNYADAHLARMSEDELSRFEIFLTLQEPELQSWLLAPLRAAADADRVPHADLIQRIRAFHGLETSAALNPPSDGSSRES